MRLARCSEGSRNPKWVRREVKIEKGGGKKKKKKKRVEVTVLEIHMEMSGGVGGNGVVEKTRTGHCCYTHM